MVKEMWLIKSRIEKVLIEGTFVFYFNHFLHDSLFR